MSLQQQIAADLTAAMKARDRQATAALRMLVSALKNAAVAEGKGPQGELDDETVQRILATEKKRRDEAAAAFEEGGRTESAASERAEAELIQRYLPEQLGDDELAAIVDEVLAEVGADAGMGPVMKGAMGRVRGRADGKRVQQVVRERLG